MKKILDIITQPITDTQAIRSEITAYILKYYHTDSLEIAYQRANIQDDVMTVGFFAGGCTRWIDSLKKYPNLKIDPTKIRALALVENLLDKGELPQLIPIGIYNVSSFRGLGHHLIIYHSNLNEIKAKIMTPLKIEVQYFNQLLNVGKNKMSGHGDALIQAEHMLNHSKYIITYFSNDAHSRKTAILSLLTMHLLEQQESPIGLLLPAAYDSQPKYPIIFDKNNNPIGVKQTKLRGDQISGQSGFTNVGVRIYRTHELKKVLQYFREIYEKENSYSSLNPNGNDEFAQDHIDELFMKQHQAKILSICSPLEMTPAKIVDCIPDFLKVMHKILQEYPIHF
jgi:hypothetical protein